MKRAAVSADGETITVHIPMTFRKRGGRKLVVTPDGAALAPRPRVDNAMVKALVRAWEGQKKGGRASCRTSLRPNPLASGRHWRDRMAQLVANGDRAAVAVRPRDPQLRRQLTRPERHEEPDEEPFYEPVGAMADFG